MADSKLTDLPALTSTQSTDLLYVVSLQEAVSGVSRKISVGDFLDNINTPVTVNELLTFDLAQGTTLQSNNITALTASADVVDANFVTSFAVVNTFTNTTTFSSPFYKSKIIHFDTTSSQLTAIFDFYNLEEGFNIGIVNTGTNTLCISTNIALRAVTNRIQNQYTGAYVYKANGGMFAVGNL